MTATIPAGGEVRLQALERPAPRAAQADADFWEGCRRGELHVQGCDACGERWFPPQEQCPACQSPSVTWVPVETRGTLYTHTVIHGPGTEGRPSWLDGSYPYAVGIVEIDGGGGARLAGMLTGVEPHRIRVGMRVRAVFRPGEAMLPDFEPEADQEPVREL